MARKNCKKYIQDAYGMSREEADQIVKQLEDVMARNEGSVRPSINVKRDAQAAATRLREQSPHDAANARRWLLLRKNFSNRVDDSPNAYDEFQAFMVGATTGRRGSLLSVDTHRQATRWQVLADMLTDLEDANHLNISKLYRNKKFGDDVGRELFAGEGAGVTGNADAKHMAKVLNKHKALLIERANRAGAQIGILKGHVIAQTHNPLKLHRVGVDEWSKFILPLLDHTRTFGEANPAQYLTRVYKNIAVGGSGQTAGEGLAGRLGRHRQLHFRDADSFLKYNDRFGDRDVIAGLFNGLAKLAEQTALMERMGHDPDSWFAAMLKKYGDRIKLEGGPTSKIFRALGRDPLSSLRNQFNAMSGADAIPSSPVMAHYAQGLRNLQNLALMGRVVFSSMPDLAGRASNAHMNGIGFFSGYAHLFQEFARGPLTADRQASWKLFGLGMNGILNDTAARINAVDGPPGMLSKWSNQMFKWNLLNWWTDRMEAGQAFMLSGWLAQHAGKPFDFLPERLQKTLQLYDIGGKEWANLRAAKAVMEDGTELITPDGVRSMDQFAGQVELEQKLRSYFVGEASTAVPRPGARERAIVLQGTKAGTPEGEALRMFAQFKMFSVTMLTKVWPRVMQDGMPGVMHLAAMMSLFGYGALTAKDITSGRKPRDPLSAKTAFEAMTAGGGFGIMGDILMENFSEYGRSFPEVIAGPGIGAVGDVARIAQGFAVGEDKRAAAFRTMMSNMPFANLFYVRPAIDYLWTYQMQELMNPGYLRRMERRIKSSGRRDFLVRPSDIVQRGGGFR